jgi:hypothetical protein
MKPTVDQVGEIIWRFVDPDSATINHDRTIDIAQAIIDQWPEPQCTDAKLAEVTAQRDRLLSRLEMARNWMDGPAIAETLIDETIAAIKGAKP